MIKNLKELKELLANAPDDTDISSLFGKQAPVIINPELPTDIPQDEGYLLSFKHTVNPGDLVAAMGCLKKYKEVTGKPIVLYQQLDVKGAYYPGANHPTTDAQGNQVTFNQYMFDMMRPLIESQDYVHSFDIYNGQTVGIDFNTIRGKTFVNLPHGPITGWLPIAFPDLSFDASKPWITLNKECPEYVRKQVKRKIVLNFTERYREPSIDYYFIKNYEPDLIFAGTEREHWLFCNQWQLSIPRLDINNFLDLAHGIKEARFTMSNQSMIWNLCQSMQTPRVLEMCRYADNCFPGIGQDSYGAFYQLGIEHSFRTMYNKTS